MDYRYHCKNTEECADFDLCVVCYDREKHPHPMEKLGFGIKGGKTRVLAPTLYGRFCVWPF